MASCSEQQGQTTIPMTAAMQRKVMSENLKDVRHKLFVMSGKGGVGKSSVTVNLAAALAAQGFNVGILDVDLHGPSVPHLLGSHGFVRVDNEDGKLVPVSCGERLSLISIESFLEDKDAAIIWRGPKKVGAIQQFVADVKWGALDYLLIDSPPGTGDEHMTILDAIPDAKCVVVTTPQEISLADVRKALDFLKVVKADVLGLVENMSGLFCPHCGEEIDLFKKGWRRSPRQTGRVELPRRDPRSDPRNGHRRGQGTSHCIHARRHPGEGRIPQARRNRAGSDASLTQQ